ncbi:hypothetical protein B0H14DRAFT_557319 [Mycena olivaceomarginata]|nr:hypothetical protein B0H14DRAFT_557319 [Mycena olivaceomarginata]
MRRATASRGGGFLCLDAGCWILDAGYHDRRRATMCLSIPRSEFSSSFLFGTALRPPFLLGPGSSSRILPPQSEALGGGGKVGGWRGRHEQKEEEGGWEPLGRGGEPRERDSATWRKEAPVAVLRMLQCVVGVPSAVRSFFPVRKLGRTAFRILFSRLRLPISSHSTQLDSFPSTPCLHLLCLLLSTSFDPYLHALPCGSAPSLPPPTLCPPAHST